LHEDTAKKVQGAKDLCAENRPGAIEALLNNNPALESARDYIELPESRPLRIDLSLFHFDYLIKAGELQQAEALLEREIKENPDSLALYLRLGLLDELKGQYLNAFDLYRQLTSLPATRKEKVLLAEARLRAAGQLKCERLYTKEELIIRIKGNRSPVELRYEHAALKRRQALLQAIFPRIDKQAESILELECETGVVSRGLAARGYRVEAVAEEMADLVLAMGFETAEVLRGETLPQPDYSLLDLTRHAATGCEEYDLILLLPPDLTWYFRRGPAEAVKILSLLKSKARRQLFFYLPGGNRGPLQSSLKGQVLGELAACGDFNGNAPKLCHESDDGGHLYLL